MKNLHTKSPKCPYKFHISYKSEMLFFFFIMGKQAQPHCRCLHMQLITTTSHVLKVELSGSGTHHPLGILAARGY